MLDSVYKKLLFDKRRSVVGWSVGIAALALFSIAFWPTIRDQQADLQSLLDAFPEGLLGVLGISEVESLFTPTGYINSRLFSNFVPILYIVYAIGLGAGATAGEEADGTLDLLLAQPVPRDRIVLEKLAAMATLLGVLAVVLSLVLYAGDIVVELDFSLEGLLAANVGAVLIALLFGSFALWIGAWTGNRGLTVGVAAAVTVTMFFANGLLPLVETLEPFQVISPFEWFVEPFPLANGFPWGRYALLTGFSVLFAGLAVWSFRRRDVAT